eukprot:767949-Hanusia_phi.AAC.8
MDEDIFSVRCARPLLLLTCSTADLDGSAPACAGLKVSSCCWQAVSAADGCFRLRLQECAEEAKITLRQFASRKGVDPSRLIFNPKVTASVYLNLLSHLPPATSTSPPHCPASTLLLYQTGSADFDPQIGDYYEHVDKLSKCR